MSSTPRKILIVDDSPTVAAVLQIQLEKAGFVVATHGHGLGTVPAILREQPDLVVLDVSMRALPGDEICKLVKKSGNGAAPQIYLHSSLDELELKQKAEQSGADGFIHKSWSPERVIETIQQAFGGQS